MTVSSTTAQQTFACNGATRAFACPFRVLATTELRGFLITVATQASVELVNGVDFTVSNVGAANAIATTATAYSSAFQFKVVRNTARLQLTDYRDNDPFPAEAHEQALDRLTHITQEQDGGITRAVLFPEPEVGQTLPAAAARANKLLGFGSSGQLLPFIPTPGDASALAIDLASTAAGKGDALIGLLRTYTGAVATTLHAWHEAQIIDLAANGGADITGALDCTAAFQAAITAGSVRFRPGIYTMSGDISIPGNRKIIVEKGATITNTGGRFTAESGGNVEWQIDGWVRSVAMATAPARPLWTALPDDRGFIEFAENYVPGSAVSGFWVHGTGKVSADWTGTPNQTDLFPYQVNRKGIAVWNAKNVLVEGLEIFGFEGEAVYAACFDAASYNIVFQDIYFHDCRFTGPNFNCGNVSGGFAIRRNFVRRCFQIESSVGDISENDIADCPGYGIYTGSGAGTGPIAIRNNSIQNCGGPLTSGGGIYATFASGSPVTDVVIENNKIKNSYAYSVFVSYCREVTVRNQTCVGSATGFGGADIGVENTLRGSVTDNTFMSPGAFALTTPVVIAASTFDVAVCPNTNIRIDTTGTAKLSGNVTGGINSAATITLPVLGNVFLISGTTNITSVSAVGCNGREVTLIFQDTLTFTDGSNLKLAGNFVTSIDDTIKLVCDGTNFYEVCRSVN